MTNLPSPRRRSLRRQAPLWIAAAATAAALPAMAKKNEQPTVRAAQIVDDLTACRAITDNGERLACFDRTAAALATARADKQVVVVDREDVRKTRRSLFGFSLPNLNIFGGGDDDEPEIKEVESTIKSASPRANDLFSVMLADGSVWNFTEPQTFPPQAGDSIKIKRGMLGSYMGSVKGRVGKRIQRVQ